MVVQIETSAPEFSLGPKTITLVFDLFRNNKQIERTTFSLHQGMQKEIPEQLVYFVSEVDIFALLK